MAGLPPEQRPELGKDLHSYIRSPEKLLVGAYRSGALRSNRRLLRLTNSGTDVTRTADLRAGVVCTRRGDEADLKGIMGDAWKRVRRD
jgi:hypothetical protein